MHCTDVERPKARKPHRCMSCGEGIAAGETYVRWRCYDGGDASTNKMHPECLAMHQDEATRYGDNAITTEKTVSRVVVIEASDADESTLGRTEYDK